MLGVNVMDFVSRVIFAVASMTLVVAATALIGLGCWQAITAFGQSARAIAPNVLDAIGYVVIAIAVFDVSKYLMEEEVFRTRQRRQASEARESLTRFISTIAIAVFLEGLVMVFEVSKEKVADLIYPTLLLATGIVVVVGLGLYQRLSATVEQEVEEPDGPS